MRKVLILLLLLIGMWFLRSVQIKDLGFYDPSLLVVVGFVLLAAYSFSELSSKFKLPKVSGYIITGILLGPSLFTVVCGPSCTTWFHDNGIYTPEILTADLVEQMKMFTTLALGLIALSAGLELSVKSLKETIANLSLLIGFKILLLVLFVGGSFLVIQKFLPVLTLSSIGSELAFALLFSVLALGTSPSLTLAVLSETGAKGRMSQLVLGAAVLKDVVVVILLFLAIALIKMTLSVDGSFDAQVLQSVLMEVGLSLLAGGMLGGILIAYLKYVKVEMLLFVAATILAGAELCEALHLEFLLVFISAGFVVRNFSQQESVLHKPLQRVALPVFVLFFTVAGAQLNLQALWTLLPVSIILVIMRGLSFYLSHRWASQATHESDKLIERGWLAYLPQAGVTLGLVGIAANQLPEFSEALINVGMGIVGINLLLGPVALRFALKSTDGIPSETTIGVEEVEVTVPKSQDRDGSSINIQFSDRHLELQTRVDQLSHEELKFYCNKVHEEWLAIIEKSFLTKTSQDLATSVRRLRTIWEGGWQSRFEFEDEIDSLFLQLNEDGHCLQALFSNMVQVIQNVPEYLEVPFTEQQRKIQKTDSISVMTNKLYWKATGRLSTHATRSLPLRKVLRKTYEPLLSTVVLRETNNYYRMLVGIVAELRKSIIKTETDEEAFTHVDSLCSQWRERSLVILTEGILSSWDETRWLLESAGGPEWSESKVRLSDIEPAITKNLQASREDLRLWSERFSYLVSSIDLVIELSNIERETRSLIGQRYFNPIALAQDKIRELIVCTKELLQQLTDDLASGPLSSDQLLAYRRRIDEIKGNQNLAAYGRRFASGGVHFIGRELNLKILKLIPRQREVIRLISILEASKEGVRPENLHIKQVNVRRLIEEDLLLDFLPPLERSLEDIDQKIESIISAVEQSLSIGSYLLDQISNHGMTAGETDRTKQDGDKNMDLISQLIESAVREQKRLEKLLDMAKSPFGKSEKDLTHRLEQAANNIREAIEKETIVQRRESWLNRIQIWQRQKISDLVELSEHYRSYLINFTTRLVDVYREDSVTTKLRALQESGSVDASGLREYIDARFNPDAWGKLPTFYQRLFSLDPVRDRRFFSAHQEIVAQFSLFGLNESAWYGRQLAVVGPRGSGRTSTINQLQVSLPMKSLVRIDRFHSRREKNILSSLAFELECRPTVVQIARELRKRNAAVIIDDLDAWFRRDQLQLMEALFEIFELTRDATFWVVSLQRENQLLFNEIFQFSQIFERIYQISALEENEMRELIMQRHQLSGLALQFPKVMDSRFLRSLIGYDEQEVFFKRLYKVTGGNIRSAMIYWMRSILSLRENEVVLDLSHRQSSDFHFLQGMPMINLLVLKELYFFGGHTNEELERILMQDQLKIVASLKFLEAAGLIRRRSTGTAPVYIPSHLSQEIGNELRKQGLM